MRHLVVFFLVFSSVIVSASGQTVPQSGVTQTPPMPPDVKGTVSAIGRQGSALIFNKKLIIDYMMLTRIENTLQEDLKEKGLTPGTDTHIYYVRVFGNDGGQRELHSYQYLAKGKSTEEALREAFAQPNGRGSTDILQEAPPQYDKEWDVYFTAVPKNGVFGAAC